MPTAARPHRKMTPRQLACRRRIRAALRDLLARGEHVNVAAIAREAGVDTKSVNRHRDILAGVTFSRPPGGSRPAKPKPTPPPGPAIDVPLARLEAAAREWVAAEVARRIAEVRAGWDEHQEMSRRAGPYRAREWYVPGSRSRIAPGV